LLISFKNSFVCPSFNLSLFSPGWCALFPKEPFCPLKVLPHGTYRRGYLLNLIRVNGQGTNITCMFFFQYRCGHRYSKNKSSKAHKLVEAFPLPDFYLGKDSILNTITDKVCPI